MLWRNLTYEEALRVLREDGITAEELSIVKDYALLATDRNP
jgi:hypothetical protein